MFEASADQFLFLKTASLSNSFKLSEI
jgi:hypothetical protein